MLLFFMCSPDKKEIYKDIFDTEKDIEDKRIALKVKQREMKRGKIWETAIGKYEHFEQLPIGHRTGCDVISYHYKILME